MCLAAEKIGEMKEFEFGYWVSGCLVSGKSQATTSQFDF